MIAEEIAARRLKMPIEQYVETRKKRHDIVSVRLAETAFKTAQPECPVSGKLLDEMIAASALAHGLAVLFDRSRGTYFLTAGRLRPIKFVGSRI